MELMKHLILFTFILSQVAFAAEKMPKKNEVKGGIVINESLQKLMDIEGVQPIYDNCKAKTPGDAEKILSCLWGDVSKKEDLKKKVQMAYEQQLKAKPESAPTAGASRAPASEAKTNLTGRVDTASIDYESDSAVAALSKYFGTKLDAVLRPELTKEETAKGLMIATSHRKFIDLYKSEQGKTIINAFTSYCMDVDPATCKCDAQKIRDCANKEDPSSCCDDKSCTISSSETQRKQDRINNLAQLKTADLSSDGPDSMKWRACISSVPNSCKSADSTQSQSETVKRSCLIMDYVETARKNILAADAQIKFYDELDKEGNVKIAGISKAVDDPKISSSDAILEMSSEDAKTALKDPLEKDKKELEACYKDNQIVNEKACEKFLSTNANANESAIAELGLRQLAQEATLEEALKSDKKVEDYLKEEGYTEKDIKVMTDKTNIKNTRDEILERYKNQKQAIIAEMAAKINSKTSSEDGKISVKDIDKLDNIRKELASRSDDLSGLVKFNNIVSSYLEVSKDGSKKYERNTASLFGEVKDLKKEDKVAAQAQLEAAKLKENNTDKGDAKTNLDITTINEEFLDYSTVPKPKKTK